MRYYAFAVVLFLPLILVGCGGVDKILATEEKHIVVMPPAAFWNCPGIPEPPSGDYTQAEVADYVLRAYQSHKVCENALQAVKEYLEQAQEITKQVRK